MIKLAVNIAFVLVLAAAEHTAADVPPASAARQTDLIELGKKLFFDPRLSASGLISCNSCHKVIIWEVDPREIQGGYRSIGRRQLGLTGAVKAGLETELGNNEKAVVQNLKNNTGYGLDFRKVFPGVTDPITFANLDKAITSFLAPHTICGSCFDRYLPGEPLVLTADLEDNWWSVAVNPEKKAPNYSDPTIGKFVYVPFLEIRVRDAGMHETDTLGTTTASGNK